MAFKRVVLAAVAALAHAAALSIAASHPVAPALAVLAVALWSVLVFIRPRVWLIAVPALLPLLNFAPWTGWFVFEEFDLLLFATVAGGWARRAAEPEGEGRVLSASQRWVLVIAFAWVAVACWRGVADAGGLAFDWFFGYESAMNSVRLFKSALFAALIVPLLLRELSADRHGTLGRFALGMALGLAIEVAAVVWERLAYVGLLDFSNRYRATGLFWEMHVGGAAIDGYLALCLPFAFWALLRAKSFWSWLLAAALVAGASYAFLITFSRGVYLAVLLGVVVLVDLLRRRRATVAGMPVNTFIARWTTAGLGSLIVGWLWFWLAGYPGLLAILALAAGLVIFHPGTARFLGLQGWRSKGMSVVVILFTLEVIAVMGGGTFMMGRLSKSERDMGGRFEHWLDGVGLLQSPNHWLFGIGLGRFPAHQGREVASVEFPGGFTVGQEKGNGYARVFGPEKERFAGLFGMAQRVRGGGGGAIRVDADVRSRADGDLYLKICEKHLLYEIRCVSSVVFLNNKTLGWEHISLPLEGILPDAGKSLPRLYFFTVSALGAGQVVDVDNLRVVDAQGRSMIVNGDFAEGASHWVLNGANYFIPWHVDSLLLETLIEQGVVGLALLLAILGMAARATASNTAFSPFLVASISGLLVVGIFGSILDVPRLAFVFFVVLVLAMAEGHSTKVNAVKPQPIK